MDNLDVFMRWFAVESNENQSRFLNSLAEGLSCRCDSTSYEDQICWMAKGLNPYGRKFIKRLNAFVELQEEKP